MRRLMSKGTSFTNCPFFHNPTSLDYLPSALFYGTTINLTANERKIPLLERAGKGKEHAAGIPAIIPVIPILERCGNMLDPVS